MARVLLGVTGGIAAYKACELVRLLVKDGHEVTPVLTSDAERFVDRAHVRGARAPGGRRATSTRTCADADLLVIAPLSANTLAKLAHGLADNVLTQAALAVRGPVLVAPAMNVRMWEHPATQANLRLLVERGVHVHRAGGRASWPRASTARAAWPSRRTSSPAASSSSAPTGRCAASACS